MSRLDETKQNFKEVVALNNNFPFGMLCAGIALLVASIVECNTEEILEDDCIPEDRFGIVASVLLIVFDLVYLYLVYEGILNEQVDAGISTFLFVCWTATSGVLTFEAPFEEAGNGFVAAWLGFISALGNFIYNVRFADEMKERLVSQGLPLGLLLIGSVIVIIAGLFQGCCDEGEIVAIIAGIVSIVLVVFRIFIGGKYNRIFGTFLAVWWTVLGLLITFDEFKEVGNGFLATWICIIASYILASDRGEASNGNIPMAHPSPAPVKNEEPMETNDTTGEIF